MTLNRLRQLVGAVFFFLGNLANVLAILSTPLLTTLLTAAFLFFIFYLPHIVFIKLYELIKRKKISIFATIISLMTLLILAVFTAGNIYSSLFGFNLFRQIVQAPEPTALCTLNEFCVAWVKVGRFDDRVSGKPPRPVDKSSKVQLLPNPKAETRDQFCPAEDSISVKKTLSSDVTATAYWISSDSDSIRTPTQYEDFIRPTSGFVVSGGIAQDSCEIKNANCVAALSTSLVAGEKIRVIGCTAPLSGNLQFIRVWLKVRDPYYNRIVLKGGSNE